MTTRPLEYLNWTNGQAPAVIEAPANLRLNGWGVGVAPPCEYANWQVWLLDQWVQYLDQITTTGSPSQVLRLLNGGYWSFIASTGVLSWSQPANISIPGIPDTNNVIPAGSCTLADGDIAYVVVNAPQVLLGDISSGSNLIANVNYTGGLQTGMSITGAGIASGTTILAIGTSTLTISQNATATATQEQLITSLTGNLTVTVIAEQDWVPTLLTIMFAKRLGNIVYIGINSSQFILRDNESKPFMGSGYFDTYDVVAGQNLTEGQAVYISPGPSADLGRTLGAVYPLDVSAAYSAIRGTYAGTAISTVTSGSNVTVVYNGFFTYSSLNPGLTYYADPTTPGGITSVDPTGVGKVVPIGFAVTSTSLVLAGTGTVLNQLTSPILKYDDLGTGDGVTVSYNLSNLPLNNQSVFAFIDGKFISNANWTLSAKTVTFTTLIPQEGQSVEFQYVLAQQNYVQGFQEGPTLVSGGTYNLTGTPINKDSISVYVDGELYSKSGYGLVSGPSQSQIILTVPIAAGQDIQCTYLSPVGFFVGNNNITGFNNVGTGHPLFAFLSGNTANFKTLAVGAGLTVVDDGSTITISAPSVSGGYVPYGTILAPLVITATGGITATTDQRQLQLIKSSGGAVTVTANPQISPGVSLGQEMVIQGVSVTDTVTINDGSGVSLNGGVTWGGPGFELLGLYWNGSVWSEMFRR